MFQRAPETDRQPTQLTVDERRAYITQIAQELGIDPEVALRIAMAEGMGQDEYFSQVPGEVSVGDLQMLVENKAGKKGLGWDFMQETGIDPTVRTPETERALIRKGLETALQRGDWKYWSGRKPAGVADTEGLPLKGVARAKRQDLIPSAPAVDPASIADSPPLPLPTAPPAAARNNTTIYKQPPGNPADNGGGIMDMFKEWQKSQHEDTVGSKVLGEWMGLNPDREDDMTLGEGLGRLVFGKDKQKKELLKKADRLDSKLGSVEANLRESPPTQRGFTLANLFGLPPEEKKRTVGSALAGGIAGIFS